MGGDVVGIVTRAVLGAAVVWRFGRSDGRWGLPVGATVEPAASFAHLITRRTPGRAAR